jgi:hypothetical protein
MTHQKKSIIEYSEEYSVEELDRELIARGAQIPGEKRFKFDDTMGPPERDTIMRQVKEIYDAARSLSPNEALGHISTGQLVKILLYKTGRIEIDDLKGRWGKDDRKDFFEIEDEQVKKNTDCAAAICLEKSLIRINNDLSVLKVKNYGKTFNLANDEPFSRQPIAAGRLCTGFLVEEDIIATAGHFAKEDNVKDLRIIFGFRMEGPSAPVTRVSNRNIYKGVKIIRRVYRSLKDDGSDWALVKLDRKVEGRATAVLSGGGTAYGQSIYVLGHPCGLPLKYAPGACVQYIDEAYFGADLDIYSGNSGSPVFDSVTHEVIGMVVRGDNRDFRWTGRDWISVIYPNSRIPSKKPQCTRVSEFRNIVAGERVR